MTIKVDLATLKPMIKKTKMPQMRKTAGISANIVKSPIVLLFSETVKKTTKFGDDGFCGYSLDPCGAIP